MQARDLGKLETWSQATAAAIGGFAAAGAWDDRVAWWALLVALALSLALGPRLRPRRAGAAARPHGVALIAVVVDILADPCPPPGAAVGGRSPVRGKQRLNGRDHRLPLVRLGPDLDLHGGQPKADETAGR